MSDFNTHTNINWRGDVGVVEYGGGTKGQIAIFYHRAVHDPKKSLEAGRPVFVDQVYVRVAPPGERLNVVDRPATGSDAKNWPIQWAQFQQNNEQVPEGTPIDQLFADKPAVVATLRANNVFTVEQCAELSGNAIDNIGMGAQSWCNAAQKYMEQANKGVAIVHFRKEMEEKESQIRVLNQQIEMLKSEVHSLRENKKTDSLNLEEVQKLIANAMGRPQMPVAGGNIGNNFDVSTAQINAVNNERNKPKPAKKRLKLD